MQYVSLRYPERCHVQFVLLLDVESRVSICNYMIRLAQQLQQI